MRDAAKLSVPQTDSLVQVKAGLQEVFLKVGGQIITPCSLHAMQKCFGFMTKENKSPLIQKLVPRRFMAKHSSKFYWHRLRMAFKSCAGYQTNRPKKQNGWYLQSINHSYTSIHPFIPGFATLAVQTFNSAKMFSSFCFGILGQFQALIFTCRLLVAHPS